VDKSSDDHERSARLLRAVFELIDKLTPGVHLEFAGVDLETYTITVRTADGDVPLSSVSQGMTSVLALAGVLMKRLYEIHADKKDPAREPGLLLVDELDSHMHPAWQTQLPSLLKEALPNMQVLVSTHSPLIAGNMEAGEVTVVRRDPSGQVVFTPIDTSLKGFRADQILTGEAFGLETARDPETENLINEYTELMVLDERSRDPERRLAEGAQTLQVRVPTHHERQEARRAYEAIEAGIKHNLSNLAEPDREKVMQQVKLQVQESVTGSRSPQ
jgi:hypothetical protein